MARYPEVSTFIMVDLSSEESRAVYSEMQSWSGRFAIGNAVMTSTGDFKDGFAAKADRGTSHSSWTHTLCHKTYSIHATRLIAYRRP